jgi:hypothetical protein
MRTILSKTCWLLAGGMFALLLCSSVAVATHRTWVRHDAGTLCQMYDVDGKAEGLSITEAAGNTGPDGPSTLWVVCPVNLAGIFKDNIGLVRIHTNTAALQADVYFHDGNAKQRLACYMEAVTSTGAINMSEFRYSCPTQGGCTLSDSKPSYTGSNRLAFADPQYFLNRRLGLRNAATFNDVRSLAFVCGLPPVGAEPSKVIGVKTAICQRDTSRPQDYNGRTPDGGTPDGACNDMFPNP